MGAACGALCGQGDRRPGRIATKEGDPVARAFIVRFETYEQALACYEDPTYQVARRGDPRGRMRWRRPRETYKELTGRVES